MMMMNDDDWWMMNDECHVGQVLVHGSGSREPVTDWSSWSYCAERSTHQVHPSVGCRPRQWQVGSSTVLFVSAVMFYCVFASKSVALWIYFIPTSLYWWWVELTCCDFDNAMTFCCLNVCLFRTCCAIYNGALLGYRSWVKSKNWLKSLDGLIFCNFLPFCVSMNHLYAHLLCDWLSLWNLKVSWHWAARTAAFLVVHIFVAVCVPVDTNRN